MKNKLIVGALGVALIFGLAGCGQESSEATQTEPAVEEVTQESESEVVEETSEIQNDGDVTQFEYDGFNFVLPGYFIIDSSSDPDGDFITFNISDGDYKHYAMISIMRTPGMIEDSEDFKEYKQEEVLAYKEDESSNLLNYYDVDVDGISALYLENEYSEDGEVVGNEVEFLIYNPDNGDVIMVGLEDYTSLADESATSDFEAAITTTSKLQ